MGGFAEIENNQVTILVNGAETGENIDKEEARKAFEAAQQRVAQLSEGEDRQEQIKAEQALKRARAKFQAAGGMV